MDIKKLRRKIISFSYLFIVILMLCFFSGCAGFSGAVVTNSVQVPDWVTNPSKNGIVGGVGYCASHVNGITGQRELASQRALEEIARQKSVSVDSIMVVSSNSSNDLKNPTTVISSTSSFKSNSNISAYIKEVWINPVTKEMYVYMVAE